MIDYKTLYAFFVFPSLREYNLLQIRHLCVEKKAFGYKSVYVNMLTYVNMIKDAYITVSPRRGPS
jgi:hypothetical protein